MASKDEAREELERLEAAFELNGGRGVELAERIDELRAELMPDSLPEGLHMEITGSECVLLDAQEHKWLTIHCGADGDPESWQTAIIGRVLDAFGLKRNTAEGES